ncbi:MAG: hypothetical protein LIP77_05305, partial [Planctomycetes bacterium]|nr:hypothetical protein [Planctomycetota bacterium]
MTTIRNLLLGLAMAGTVLFATAALWAVELPNHQWKDEQGITVDSASEDAKRIRETENRRQSD